MLDHLPPREREIVTLLYERGAMSPAAISENLSEAVSAQAVRSMLSRLEGKGYVNRRREGRGFVYAPKIPEDTARQTALQKIVGTFFGGSAVNAASALIGMSDKLEDGDIEQLEEMIAKARAGSDPSSDEKGEVS
ncbi:BlaI/MecI/CopY family transcriptional regulator [Parvularcula sp. IMCC14364]|uniref:BlaI/MecI/CopY family transcriptional regulator n=1 Tax=Parvularcula sp. IMCC14364 TaxID=3067902 RepID=UPI002742550A|nr:BlaI/MecI/CopY family transcriptional regulator [Parvularcula sp. IMCC14364]